jgi:hypothetical protein
MRRFVLNGVGAGATLIIAFFAAYRSRRRFIHSAIVPVDLPGNPEAKTLLFDQEVLYGKEFLFGGRPHKKGTKMFLRAFY